MMNWPAIISREPLRRGLAILPWAVAGAMLAYAFITGGYFATVMSFAMIYAVFVVGLNVFMGFAGQVSFGHNAFAGLSGYASAILSANYYWDPALAFAAGLSLTLMVALVIGWPTLRLKGHYLAMATLAIGLIVYEIAIQWQSVTQGYMGISGISPLGIAGYEIVSDRGKLFALFVIVVLASLAAARLRASRFGRALAAIAGSEDAARALGIDVARYKLLAFLISAAYAALAGSLFVHVVEFVSPEVFGLNMVVLSFTMLYVGGIGTLGGPVLGAVIVSLLPEIFRGLKDYQDLVLRRRADRSADLRAEGPGRPRQHRWTPGPGMTLLSLQGVTRRYGGLIAVDAIDLEVAEGGVAAVIGPNGAGKTTLFNLISGFQTLNAGRIVFNGADITGRAPEAIAAAGLVRTFQLVQLFGNLSVLENIQVGCHLHTTGGVWSALLRSPRMRQTEREIETRARELLGTVGLDAAADAEASALPYGQQRLLEIARALAARPRLLLLDEPAAGLSPDETKRLSATIRAVAGRGTTVLLIEHDMQLVMNTADTVTVIDFGRKIAEGPPAAVRQNPAVVAAYLGVAHA